MLYLSEGNMRYVAEYDNEEYICDSFVYWMEDGDTILLEPEKEVSYQVVDERDKADFNRMEVKNILPELSLFLRSFFDNVQLPNFAKNTLKR